MGRRLILHGAGAAGRAALGRIRRGDRVVCFADGDSAKAGSVVEGIPVISPRGILEREFDLVVITSQHGAEIRAQLADLGVDPLRVVDAETYRRFRLNPAVLDALEARAIGVFYDVVVGTAARLLRVLRVLPSTPAFKSSSWDRVR